MAAEVSYEALFLRALLCTLLLELPIVLLLMNRGPWRTDSGWWRSVASGTLPTLLTLPYLWFLGPWLSSDRFLQAAVGEPAVAMVEAVAIRSLAGGTWKRALLVSVAANLGSWSAGWFLPLL